MDAELQGAALHSPTGDLPLLSLDVHGLLLWQHGIGGGGAVGSLEKTDVQFSLSYHYVWNFYS